MTLHEFRQRAYYLLIWVWINLSLILKLNGIKGWFLSAWMLTVVGSDCILSDNTFAINISQLGLKNLNPLLNVKTRYL